MVEQRQLRNHSITQNNTGARGTGGIKGCHMEASPSFSGHGTFLSRRSCEQRRRKSRLRAASCFPMNGSLFFALPAGKRNPASGWTKSGPWPVEILTPFGRNLQASPADDEAPKPFRFRGFIYPGSYLLSRDLSSDYHRRADVSLPGSEWDRVGPSGYDHQVSGSFSLLCSLLTSVIICACGFLWCFCWLPFSAAG